MAVILQPSILDTYIIENAPNTSYGTAAEMWLNGYTATYRSRILIKFDMSSILPTAQFTSAVLSIYCATHAQTITINAYRILRAWTESATWNGYGGGSWGTAGCNNTTSDRSGTSMGSASNSGTGWFDLTLSNAEMALLLASNNGICLIGYNASPSGDNKYLPREYGTPASRPKLVVDYITPGGLSVGAFLGDYGVM